ncbi:MAG: DUF3237 domain-containing protein [Acidimicrobiia bacterium]|nr:DUF3237 domain-containing protein [Acidimicrobiia bacterium]
MGIELVPLCVATVDLADPMVLPDTPEGTLCIFEVLDAIFEGERIRGRLAGRAAADWLRVSPAGIGTLDVRATMQTDDGALVYLAYRGRANVGKGPGEPVYGTPLFNTGDDRYTWLNEIQAVYKGTFDPEASRLVYDCYELR